ncbi:MAG TPA: hypothetical protein VMM77_05450 [Gemmatimonadaceae bacterium]|nr:hypothetical protein [Gemmatimonadaceae bacterium]
MARSQPIDAYRLTLVLAAVLFASSSAPAAAQGPVQRADELLRQGRIMSAESLYYAAANLTPRDPKARHALGRYLVSRGRLRIGATLIEEARFFGGDVRIAAEALAPLYAALHDYRALAALPYTPLNAAERQRVIWLRDNPPVSDGTDSAVVRLHNGSGSAIARIPVTIAGEQVLATLDPTVRGLVVDTGWIRRPGLRRFAITPGGNVNHTPLVVLELKIGSLILRNVPARVGDTPGVTIGLDVIGQLTPTFDAAAEMLVVRRARRVPRGRGEQLPTLVQSDAWLISTGDRLLPLHGNEARNLLDGRRWTLHARRGIVTVER